MTDAASSHPASALPTSWNPQEIEPGLYDGWVNAGYFTPDASSGKTPYSVVLPPPNVTGQLHMGHALNQTIIDVLTRRKRMQGYEVLWLPGTDHAGIATQTKVEAQLIEESGLTRHDLGRDGFLDKVWEWKDSYHARITGQIRSLGAGVDWSRERFTLDEGLSRAVQTIFKQLFDAGMIYRAERLVNWSPTLKTAISDIEVDYKDVDGELVSIRYGSLDDAEPHVIVATTRVETMLGDVAVAVHPEDERYTDLIGTRLPHPFIADRTMIVVADDYVDPEFGTGAVKITPAHDPNDFELGRRHNLPMPTIMDAAGAIADTGTQFDGLDRFEARVKIREALAAQGRIVKEIRPYNHSVGHSDRSGEPIEPRLSLQWWVDVKKLAAYSAAAVREGDTAIHPAAQEPRWFDWVDDMHDWTISRQLWWGHRIPIYYGPDGEVICCGPDEQPPAGYVQDSDVLDTWFSSALFPFSTMGWPEKTEDLATFYPTSVLVTGYDILFFWVARMMMFGTFVATQEGWLNDAGRPIPPFTDVLLHGMVRDEFGQKMSKSKGNGIDPLDWVETYGTDALRFTLARGANPGADLNVGTDYAESSRNFVTKLFNATKFALLNGAHVGELPPREELTDADRWILDELESVRAQVDGAFDNYELAKACQALYRFAWDEFCDWYLEIAKAQLPGRDDTPDAAGLQRAEHTRIVLGRVLDTVMRLLAPVMPFVTEVLWQAVAGPERDTESLVIAEWPSAAHTNHGAATDERAATRIADLKHLVTEIRRFRNDQGVKPSQKVPARFGEEAGDGLTTADLAALEPVIASLVRLEQPDAEFSPSASIEVRLSQATIVVELDTSGTVDLAAERKRLDKDLAAAEKELAGTTAKLGNEAFLAKAPDHVVEKIRTRKQVAEEEIARITARLAQLQG